VVYELTRPHTISGRFGFCGDRRYDWRFRRLDES